jgi:hypothetical protein
VAGDHRLYLVLGVAAAVGGLVHAIGGERWIIARLDPGRLARSILGDGDISRRYLRWFWHVGTADILGAASLFLGVGVGVLRVPPIVFQVLALHLGLYVVAFAISFARRPAAWWRVPQAWAMLAGAVATWLAASGP